MATAPKADEVKQSFLAWAALASGGFLTILGWSKPYSFVHDDDHVVTAYLIAMAILFGVATVAISGTSAGRQNAGAAAKGLLPATALLLAGCADQRGGMEAWIGLALVLISIVIARMAAANWPDPP